MLRPGLNLVNGLMLVTYLDYTQYKKALTLAIGCDCSHRQPSEEERL